MTSLVAEWQKNLPEKQETQVLSLVGKIPWRIKWQPTPVFLPGESYGLRRLVGWIYLQFSLVTQLCPTLWDPRNCITPGFPAHHQLPELSQTHVHQVVNAIQLYHPLSSPPLSFSLSKHQGLFQRVSSSFPVSLSHHWMARDIDSFIPDYFFSKNICYHKPWEIEIMDPSKTGSFVLWSE